VKFNFSVVLIVITVVALSRIQSVIGLEIYCFVCYFNLKVTNMIDSNLVFSLRLCANSWVHITEICNGRNNLSIVKINFSVDRILLIVVMTDISCMNYLRC
jgi:hypothetical protein